MGRALAGTFQKILEECERPMSHSDAAHTEPRPDRRMAAPARSAVRGEARMKRQAGGDVVTVPGVVAKSATLALMLLASRVVPNQNASVCFNSLNQ